MPDKTKTAWIWSARAFEASCNQHAPRLLRHVLVRAGVVCFWAALALERRAFEVWRDQRTQRALVREGQRPVHHSVRHHARTWLEGLRDRLGWRSQCLPVAAWSLPD